MHIHNIVENEALYDSRKVIPTPFKQHIRGNHSLFEIWALCAHGNIATGLEEKVMMQVTTPSRSSS
jgi:hypothetical protein